MFTLSVVLGSSILYKDFNSATPERLLKFIFGCLSTFIGVYLITSKRHVHHLPKPRRSMPHLSGSPESETAPLMIVDSPICSSPSDELGETPPHLIGTSFGYHFTNPRILERRASRSTLPKLKGRKDDLVGNNRSRRRQDSDEYGNPELRPEGMGRTQSDIPTTTSNESLTGEGREDSQSDIVEGRNRGNSIV
jgi:hypothetical protein